MSFNFGATPGAVAPAPTATTTSSFSFGAPAPAATASSFSFGAPAAPTFGAPAAPTTTSSFSFGGSAAPATTAAPSATGFKGFSGFGTGATGGFSGLSGFGTNTTTTGSTFGTNTFGTGTAGTGGSFFGGFGAPTATTGSTFGAPAGAGSFFGSSQQQQAQQAQQQQQQAANQLDNLAKAVMMPHIFNDERDAIIAKWNLLQAYWGTGRAYFDSSGFVDLTSENLLCRFKAIGYSCIPQSKDEDGLVGLVLKKPYTEVKTNQKVLTDALHQILGGKPTFSVCVSGVKQWPDNKTEMVIYIVERHMTGQTRRYPTSKIIDDLNNVTVKKKMEDNPLNVEHILSKRSLNTEQMKQYLENPPAGIEPLLWQQAKKDNPDSDSFVPIPIVGFKELLQRLKQQDQHTKSHQSRLDLIAQGLNELQNKQRNTVARVEEAKRKHLNLGHRLLKVIAKQEVYRKLGVAMQDTEEQFRAQLEALQSELNHPTQFKGRLNELLSQIRMQNHMTASRADTNYQMEPLMEEEIRELLKQQQTGIHHIVELMKEDSADLCLIEEGLSDISARNSR